MVGLNFYRNAHYGILNKMKKFFHDLVEEELCGRVPLKGQVEVHYKIFLKRRGSDGGNVGSVIAKYALDGAVTAGIILDDNADIVVRETFEYFYDKTYPRAEVTIKELRISL